MLRLLQRPLSSASVSLLPRRCPLAYLPSIPPKAIHSRTFHSVKGLRDADSASSSNSSETVAPSPAETLKAEAPGLYRLLFEVTAAELRAETSLGILHNILANQETVDAYVRFLVAQLEHDPRGVIGAVERLGVDNPKRAEPLATYVKALAATHSPQRIGTLLQHAFAKELGRESSPMHVTMHPTRWSSAFSLLSLLLTAFLVGLIYFSVKGSGEGTLSDRIVGAKKYSPLESPGSTTFLDVMGNNEAKEELADIVAYLKNPQRFANVKVPKGVLMVGPPGTGKTLLARALAGEAGVAFITASGSEFEEVFVGVGASRIRQLFEDARKKAPCIIFIDELDAVGGRRDENKTRATNQTLNQLLVELDGFSGRDGVILIGATNMPSQLDPALVRPGRFDRKVHLNLPVQGERKEILDYYLSKQTLDEDVDAFALSRATAGFSGADLENMVNWAAIEAIKEDRDLIDSELLGKALLNVSMGREKKSMVISEKVKKITAYHEGGHALCALYGKGAPEIRHATLLPRGDALGFVDLLSTDEYLTTREAYLGQLRMAMGGRVAEELIFGADQVTSGAASDFEQATNIAHTMVTKFGMSDKVGHLYLTKNTGYDEKLIAEEVKSLVEKAYAEAKALLEERHVELHRLADALLLYESLDKDEIVRVVRGEVLHDRGVRERAEKAKRAERRRLREAREAEALAASHRAAPDLAATAAEQEAARAALHSRSQ